jgi:hypothetical protein
MCAWDRFCAFAREPERRKVGIDAKVSVDGIAYEVDAGLAGEEVVLWWGLFDQGSGHESAFYALFVRTNRQPWLW